jgi:hypothetical protein
MAVMSFGISFLGEALLILRDIVEYLMPWRFGLNPDVCLGPNAWIIIQRSSSNQDDLRPAVDASEDVRSAFLAKAAVFSRRGFVRNQILLPSDELEARGFNDKNRTVSGAREFAAIRTVTVRKPEHSTMALVSYRSTIAAASYHVLPPSPVVGSPPA